MACLINSLNVCSKETNWETINSNLPPFYTSYGDVTCLAFLLNQFYYKITEQIFHTGFVCVCACVVLWKCEAAFGVQNS